MMPPLPLDTADAAGNKANLRITQYHGTPTGANIPANYPAGGANRVTIIPTAVSYNHIQNRWEVTFPVTGFSGFFASTNLAAPLPVGVLGFTAHSTDGVNNRVRWATATEDAGTTFEIMRGSGGSEFAAIGTIAGKGNNSDYSFYDEKPLNGINYYRLKATEANGAVTYSKTVTVNNSAFAKTGITMAPVPAHSSINITNTNPVFDGGVINITDMQGRQVYRTVLHGTTTIDITSLADGVYSVHLPSGEVMRMVKQ